MEVLKKMKVDMQRDLHNAFQDMYVDYTKPFKINILRFGKLSQIDVRTITLLITYTVMVKNGRLAEKKLNLVFTIQVRY